MGPTLSVCLRVIYLSYRESNKESKERQGPTLGVHFTKVSIKRESTVFYTSQISCMWMNTYIQETRMMFWKCKLQSSKSSCCLHSVYCNLFTVRCLALRGLQICCAHLIGWSNSKAETQVANISIYLLGVCSWHHPVVMPGCILGLPGNIILSAKSKCCGALSCFIQ